MKRTYGFSGEQGHHLDITLGVRVGLLQVHRRVRLDVDGETPGKAIPIVFEDFNPKLAVGTGRPYDERRDVGLEEEEAFAFEAKGGAGIGYFLALGIAGAGGGER
jgi:hypothetical protein